MRHPLLLLFTSLLCVAALFGCVGCFNAPLGNSPPAPARPSLPPKPLPVSRTKVLVFTQRGCAPCVRVLTMLDDRALADTMSRFELQVIKWPDRLFRDYHITSTPAVIVLTGHGPERCPNPGDMSLGQMLSWLSEWETKGTAIEATREGGPVGPDGEQVACDLPVELRAHNVGGRDGAGLCVFTSIMHAAREQNERRLWDLQTDMRKEMGGGWPGKVDSMLKKYGKGSPYIQYEGSDPSILELALRTGRMPGVTYNGHDCHYRGGIAHMVNLVYLDKKAACILDNNFIGENELVWMTREDFMQRWTGGRSGWAVVLLAGRPPAPPRGK